MPCEVNMSEVSDREAIGRESPMLIVEIYGAEEITILSEKVLDLVRVPSGS